MTNSSWAGQVREVGANALSMTPVYLKLGQSTVLRFPEKPKKVILGNSNYYSVEFIDNDIAIQPHGSIPTNLFVYGPKNVYGFLIRNCSDGNYDDLVHVTWKEKIKEQYAFATVVKPSAFRVVSKPGLEFRVGKVLRAQIDQVQRLKKGDLYLVDLALKNVSSKEMDLKSVSIEAFQKRTRIPTQEFILRESHLKSGESTQARVFLSLPEKQKDFTLQVRLGDQKGNQIILGKYL